MIINPKTKNSSRQNGFTIIELLVAMSLFVIIVTIAVGSFISAMRTQRVLVALMAVNDNTSLAIEQMAREIRAGESSSFPASVSGIDCGLTSLSFKNSAGNKVKYSVENGSLSKTDITTNNKQSITASNVNVKKIEFCISNKIDDDNIPIIPARITIILEVAVSSTSAIGVQGVSTNLQTTISARNLE